MAIYSTTFSLGIENPISESGIWDSGSGNMSTMQVVTGAVCQPSAISATAINQARLVSPAIGPNQYARGVIANDSTGGSIHLNVRIQGPSDGSCYLARFNTGAPGAVDIVRFDNAAPPGGTLIGSAINITPQLINGDTVELRISGTTLMVIALGTIWNTQTDATLTTGQPGFGCDCATAITSQSWDAWAGGDLPAVQVLPLGTPTFNTTATSAKAVTATPTVGDLIIIAAGHTANVATTTPTDNNPDGLGAYTLVESRVKTTSLDRLSLFVRNSLIGASGGASTIFTHTPAGTTTGGGIAVMRVTGMSVGGLSAIVRSGGADNLTSAAPGMSWTSGSSTGVNPVITAVLNSVNSATQFTRPSGFDLMPATGAYNTPPTGLAVASDDTGFTGTTIPNWTIATSSACCVVGLELAAPAAAATSLVIPSIFPRALLVR